MAIKPEDGNGIERRMPLAVSFAVIMAMRP
jgi:hypothetical protein